MLVLCIEVLLCWVLRHLQSSCLPLGLIPWSLCSILPYLLLLLSCFGRVRLCATPQTAAHQAPPSLGFFFILGSILSDMRITTPAFFCFPFSWNIFFHPLNFSIHISSGLKWVSYRQHIYGSCLCICSASLCLLVGVFNPSTFKVVIDIYVPIAIFFF